MASWRRRIALQVKNKMGMTLLDIIAAIPQKPYYQEPSGALYCGDALVILKQMPDNFIQCCITSPPYWGLRDYGTASWEGGDPECNHVRDSKKSINCITGHAKNPIVGDAIYKDICPKCGAVRIDSQLGLEKTPEEYIAKMVEVFREVKRVLRDDGVFFLNLGDSYARSGGAHKENHKNPGISNSFNRNGNPHWGELGQPGNYLAPNGLKPKDLVGIPWRVAFALQQPYYTGRIKDKKDRIWMGAMIDAEGSICGTEYDFNGKTKTNLYISVTNSAKSIIDNCERIYPQEIKHTYLKNGKRNKDVWRWDVEKMGVKQNFICEIYPYLIAKRKQAIIGYNFLEFQRGLFSKKKGYLQGQKEKRHWMMQSLSKLNHGGEIDLPSWLKEPPSLFEEGFYLRQDVIWSKPNPMPESVTDRCTKAHEYVFMLTKSAQYYYDSEAIKENSDYDECFYRRKLRVSANYNLKEPYKNNFPVPAEGGKRNKRSVWTITTKPFKDAHFATFPPDLIQPMILAGTSERGNCPKCGKAWKRIIKQNRLKRTELPVDDPRYRPNTYNGSYVDINGKGDAGYTETTTLGWQPMCECYNVEVISKQPRKPSREEKLAQWELDMIAWYKKWNELKPIYDRLKTVPPIILDLFIGSGTTAQEAKRYGRDFIGIDLNSKYLDMSIKRLHSIPESLFKPNKEA